MLRRDGRECESAGSWTGLANAADASNIYVNDRLRMFGIGAGEMMIFAMVLLIALGPGKMPGFMKAVGKGMREFRRASRELRKQSGIDELLSEDDPIGIRKLQADILKEPAPRPKTLATEDVRREQPPEGVDVVDARARAVKQRAETKRRGADANRAAPTSASESSDDASDEDVDAAIAPIPRETELVEDEP